MLKKALKATVISIGIIAFLSALTPHILHAMEREAQWRQDRLCKYHGAEINAYAARQGKSEPCEEM